MYIDKKRYRILLASGSTTFMVRCLPLLEKQIKQFMPVTEQKDKKLKDVISKSPPQISETKKLQKWMEITQNH